MQLSAKGCISNCHYYYTILFLSLFFCKDTKYYLHYTQYYKKITYTYCIIQQSWGMGTKKGRLHPHTDDHKLRILGF